VYFLSFAAVVRIGWFIAIFCVYFDVLFVTPLPASLRTLQEFLSHSNLEHIWPSSNKLRVCRQRGREG